MSDYIQLINSLDISLNDERYKTMVKELLETLLKQLVLSIKSDMEFKELQYLQENQRSLYKMISRHSFDDVEIMKVFYLAYMKAILDVKSYSDKESLKGENSVSLLKSHKRLANLIECLYNENSLTHQELADRMGISKSNLSNLVNEPDITTLITKRRYRKKVYYSISNDGHKLYKQIAIYNSNKFSSEQYTELFIQLIDSVQTEISSEYVNINRFWNGVTRDFGNNVVFTKSNTIRNKLNKLIDTVSKQKPYNVYDASVRFRDNNTRKHTAKKPLLSIKVSKGDSYEYYK